MRVKRTSLSSRHPVEALFASSVLQDPAQMDEPALKSDAVWFRPPMRHDGLNIQDLLIDVMQNYVAVRGYNLKKDVQVQLYYMLVSMCFLYRQLMEALSPVFVRGLTF